MDMLTEVLGSIDSKEISGHKQSIIDRISPLASLIYEKGIDYKRFNTYIVCKKTGGYRLFHTMDNTVIKDKVEGSYVESRDLICLEQWNISGIYKIEYRDNYMLVYPDTLVNLRQVLFAVVDPSTTTYAIVTNEGVFDKFTLDYEHYGELTYEQTLQIIRETCKGISTKNNVDPCDWGICIIDYKWG